MVLLRCVQSGNVVGVTWFYCDVCNQEMLLADYLLQDAAIKGRGIEASEDICIAGPWPGLQAFQESSDNGRENEVKNLGGESIFTMKSFNERMEERFNRHADKYVVDYA
jgi:hypothetical protein